MLSRKSYTCICVVGKLHAYGTSLPNTAYCQSLHLINDEHCLLSGIYINLTSKTGTECTEIFENK